MCVLELLKLRLMCESHGALSYTCGAFFEIQTDCGDLSSSERWAALQSVRFLKEITPGKKPHSSGDS